MPILINGFHRSISESGIWTPEEVGTIWDFYVTKSVASSAAQKRSAQDYGLKELPFDSLLDYAGVPKNQRELIMANSIDGILAEYGFKTEQKKDGKNVEIPIDVDSLRLVAIQPYSITDRNPPAAKGGGKAITLLTHIRNSLAHGCTYFFDNGNMLLQDRACGSSGRTTAMMLLPQSAFLDWIRIIDIGARFYLDGQDRSDFESLVIRKKPKE